MKYSSHIGAVVVENVRIYHELVYILVICEYLQHKILECLRRRGKPTDAFAAAFYCLQVSEHIWKDVLNFGNIMQFSKFWGG